MAPKPTRVEKQDRFILMPKVSEEDADLIVRDVKRLSGVDLRVTRTYTQKSNETKWVFYEGRVRVFWITFQPKENRLWFSNPVCTVWREQQDKIEERLTRAFKSDASFRRTRDRILLKMRKDPATSFARVMVGHSWDEP